MAETIKIGGELESTATGNVVAAASAIKDKVKNKYQDEINAETDATLNNHASAIQGLNSQNYVTVTATDQTTDVTDVLPATGAANTVYRVGNWNGSQFDANVYSEYAWDGSQYVHLSTKTQIGEVFDISAYHATGGTLATYADLSAALDSNNGGGVPQSLQKGGMSVKFVHTSDNKYLQARCMAQNFSTDPNDWQGVDKVPTPGSKNFVESGGVYDTIDMLKVQTIGEIIIPEWYQGNINGSTGKFASTNLRVTNKVAINAGASIRVICSGDVRMNIVSKYKASASPVDGGVAGTDFVEMVLPSTESRTDKIFEFDQSFPNIYITFARASNSSSEITAEEVAANVQFINQGSIRVVLDKTIDEINMKDDMPSPTSDKIVASKGIYPFAKEVIKNKAGKNLCNPLSPRFILNAFIKPDGEESVVSPSYAVCITDYIAVSENGLVINHPKHMGTYSVTFAVYDSQYNFIRYESSNSVYTYVEGDAYVRFNCDIAYKDEIQVEEGTTSTDFEQYNGIKGYLDETVRFIEDKFSDYLLKKDVYNNSGEYNRGLQRIFTGLNIKQGDWFKVKIVSSSQATNPVIFIGVNNKAQRLLEYPVIGTDYFFKLGTTPTVSVTDTTITEIDIYVNAVSGGDPIEVETELVVYNNYIDSVELTDSNDKLPTSHVVKNAIDDAVSGAGTLPDDIIVMPSVTYALKGTENSIYHKNYLKYEHPDFFVAPHSAFNHNGWNFTDRYFRVTNPVNPNILVDIRNTKTCEVMKSTTAVVTMGDPATNNGAKVVNVIGDSFTANGNWFKIIYDLCPDLSFVGMRYPRVSEQSHEVKCEGRLGWKLSDYFLPYGDVTPTHLQPFSPFLHVAGYTYYGVIDFWKAIVNDNSQYEMGTFGFDSYKAWFDTNGYKVSPSQNDLMYDGANNKYVYWNGSAWADFSGTPTFAFDYAKYLSTWEIDTPDFVMIMLGKNDFQASASAADFSGWKTKMDIVIESIHAVNSSAIIGICTPTVANEAPMNSDNNAPQVGGRNMWLARKFMIDTFDVTAYKNGNVFIVDTGICLDPVYGFLNSEIKPFTFYSGTEREIYATNGVHPSNEGYKQLGVCAAGFIQYIRSL